MAPTLVCVYGLAGQIRLLLHEVCGPRIMIALIAALCDLAEGKAGVFSSAIPVVRPLRY